MPSVPHVVAVIGQPLFGNQWLALLAVMACITVFLFLVAATGRWLAATHPESPAPAPRAEPASDTACTPPPEVLAAIAAAVATTLGPRARVTSITAKPASHSVEALMQQWSLEGRRQIYTSHKVR